jgi:hypothetical protein
MRRVLMFGVISLITALAFGKDKPTVTIQVVSSQGSKREYTYTTPATAGTSTTSCNTNGSVNGDYVNANTDCSTTSTPGTPASSHTSYIPQEHVYAIMPDGNHVTLWCQEGWRHCASLQPGHYDAELKGDAAWIHTHDLSGKVRKVKYHAVGGWSEGQAREGVPLPH